MNEPQKCQSPNCPYPDWPLAEAYKERRAAYVAERKYHPECGKTMWRGRRRKAAPVPSEIPVGRVPVWKNHQIDAYALVDPADHDVVNAHRWSYAGRGYVARRVYDYSTPTPRRSRYLYLHRELMGLKPGDGLEVDHKNGNVLDNRRENLRIPSSVAEHRQNVRPWGKSKYRGVGWDEATGKYLAYVTVNKKTHWLGRHATEQEAAAVALAKRRELMPYSVEDNLPVMTREHPLWEEFCERLAGPGNCDLHVEEGKPTWSCKGDFRYADVLLMETGCDIPRSEMYFEENSAFCDCEILLNVHG